MHQVKINRLKKLGLLKIHILHKTKRCGEEVILAFCGKPPTEGLLTTSRVNEVTCRTCKESYYKLRLAKIRHEIREIQGEHANLTVGCFKNPIINEKSSDDDKKKLKDYLEMKRQKFDNFKLNMMAIPNFITNYSLFNILDKLDWDRIRHIVFDKSGNKCSICHSSGVILNCHEVWIHDDVNLIQYLKECVSLCVLCHSATHPTRASKNAEEGKYEFKKVVEHFMRINECDEKTFDEYKDYIQDLELYRTIVLTEDRKKAWHIDYGEYNDLVLRRCGDINAIIRKNTILKDDKFEKSAGSAGW